MGMNNVFYRGKAFLDGKYDDLRAGLVFSGTPASPQCGGTGYRGRTVLAEMLTLDQAPLGAAILRRADVSEVERLAIELDCDARVLRRMPRVRAYALLLLELGARRSHLPFAVAAFAEHIHANHPAMDVVMNIAGVSAWGTVDQLTHLLGGVLQRLRHHPNKSKHYRRNPLRHPCRGIIVPMTLGTVLRKTAPYGLASNPRLDTRA